MKYKIKIIESEEGFAIWCEDLQGCFSQGDTEEEAISNIKIAIKEYIEAKSELENNEKFMLIEV